MKVMKFKLTHRPVNGLWTILGSLKRRWRLVQPAFVRFLFLVLIAISLRFDVMPRTDREAGLDQLLSGKLFGFTAWWIDAAGEKLSFELITPQRNMTEAEQVQFVRAYVNGVRQFYRLENRIATVYTDPAVSDPLIASSALRQERDTWRSWLDARQNLVEAIIQEQVESVLRDEGFALGGQVMPPVRFRFTQLPDVLIISRRDKIERIDQRTLRLGLTVDQFDSMEQAVDQRFDVSSIVEPIGGLGSYPTMLGESSALDWVTRVVAHEWTHNYLLSSYVGLNYGSDPTARIINETTAQLVEEDIGPRVMRRFYPDLAGLDADPGQEGAIGEVGAVTQAGAQTCCLTALLLPGPATASTDFDFNIEMRETRLTADDLLAQGKIEQAEAYMEVRRALFVDNGYAIRKLNQAYFAFHGAYNSQPGGSPTAGRDPIGPAVQALRARSASIGDFMRAIARVRSLEDVKKADLKTLP